MKNLLVALSSWVKKALAHWDTFWFQSDHPLALSLIRISLGISMFLVYIGRFSELEYYKHEAAISYHFIETMIQPVLNVPFFKLFSLGISVFWLQVIFMILIVLFTLGVLNRAGVFIFWLLHFSFLNRNPAIIYGADFVSSTFLFYLIFANSQRRLSLSSLFRSNKKTSSSDLLSSVSVRLIQIQMCLIYAITGFEKFKGGTWWDGTALWNVLANPQFTISDLTWLRHLPLLIVFLSIMTLIFEVYFPVMVFSKNLRKPWLFIGLTFHLGIVALLGLYTFSFVMLSIYWIFLKESEILSIFSKQPLKKIFLLFKTAP